MTRAQRSDWIKGTTLTKEDNGKPVRLPAIPSCPRSLLDEFSPRGGRHIVAHGAKPWDGKTLRIVGGPS